MIYLYLFLSAAVSIALFWVYTDVRECSICAGTGRALGDDGQLSRCPICGGRRAIYEVSQEACCY